MLIINKQPKPLIYNRDDVLSLKKGTIVINQYDILCLVADGVLVTIDDGNLFKPQQIDVTAEFTVVPDGTECIIRQS